MAWNKKPKPEPLPPSDPLEAAQECIDGFRKVNGKKYDSPHRDNGPYLMLHLLRIQIEILKELRKENEK